ELNGDYGMDLYEYGFRWYDAAIGRFTGVDPLAADYASISTYAYVANNPINAIDPDGRRIIFINGYKGFGSPEGGERYWGGSNSAFVRGAMKYLNDKDTYFADIDHGALSSNSTRISAGRKWAENNLATLTDGLDKDVDDIKFVTHSMGAAFSEGVSEYLKEQGGTVSDAIHFNAYQADGLEVDGESTTVIDYQLNNDPVTFFGPTSNPGRIRGAQTTIYEKGESDIQYRHREPIDSGEIWNRLNTLIEEALKRDGNTKINIQN
uniref:RHS repeat-associated core domain-containing protein n=1 Tax=Phaeodactylibacter xiamenensis TaxID=1524460 RepID=UPI0024A7DC0A